MVVISDKCTDTDVNLILTIQTTVNDFKGRTHQYGCFLISAI